MTLEDQHSADKFSFIKNLDDVQTKVRNIVSYIRPIWDEKLGSIPEA